MKYLLKKVWWFQIFFVSLHRIKDILSPKGDL